MVNQMQQWIRKGNHAPFPQLHCDGKSVWKTISSANHIFEDEVGQQKRSIIPAAQHENCKWFCPGLSNQGRSNPAILLETDR